MADVTTYRMCIMPHHRGAEVITYGTIRAATDPAVVALPAFWVALSDASIVARKVHE